MIVHLSTSSSNERLPKANWLTLWLGIIVIVFLSISFFEWHLRSLGWSPSVVDSPDLWVEQRQRASNLGDKALILVGASRMQLDIDMSVLREKTDLEPVQLAIDGTSYIPVLENLADDPSITGTIFVSVNAYNMRKGKPDDTSELWVNYYKNIQSRGIEPYRQINNKVVSFFNNSLVTHLEGAKPYTIISKLGFQKPSMGNYLITHSDRSRDADYKKVQMPNFYAARLQRHYGNNLVNGSVTFKEFFTIYEKAIAETQSFNKEGFSKELNYLLFLVKKIEEKGGKVVLIRFPTGKLVWQVDNKRYPKTLFWKDIKKQHPQSIHFSELTEASFFNLPDGSHLDFRDKHKFTNTLINKVKDIFEI